MSDNRHEDPPATPRPVWYRGRPRPGPIRHPPLTEHYPTFRRFQRTFRGLYDQTVPGWDDGFRRDIDPSLEIALWEHIEACLLRFTRGRVSPRQQEKIFRVILATTTHGPEWVAAHPPARGLTRRRVREIAFAVATTYPPALAARAERRYPGGGTGVGMFPLTVIRFSPDRPVPPAG